MNTFKYMVLLYLQIQNGCCIIPFLKDSLDIFDWCIVFGNEIGSNEPSEGSDFYGYWSFMTPNDFNCLIYYNTLILLHELEWNNTRTILDEITQYQLANNYLVIHTKDSSLKFSMVNYERPLTIRANIFIFEPTPNGFSVYQIIGTATKFQKLKALGHSTHLNLNLKSIVKETRMNRDLNGIEVKANYGHFPPFCIVSPPNQVNGTFHEVLETMSLVLNFTLKLQSSHHEHWGNM